LTASQPQAAGSYIIRPGTGNDCGAIASIYNEGVSDRNATFDESEVSPERYQRYFQNDQRSGLLCAATAEEVIGWGAVDPRSERFAYRFTGQLSLYVRRTHRNRGIGTDLTRALDDLALDLGYHSLISENLSTNPRSLAVDLKNGYHIVGEVREAGFRDGNWVGLIITQKIIVR
jgi:L-amino acid N-acyltransferase YncA